MGKLIVHQDKVTDINAMISICPFNALEEKDGKLEVNAGCKLCKLCVKKGQPGAMEYVEEEVKTSRRKRALKMQISLLLQAVV